MYVRVTRTTDEQQEWEDGEKRGGNEKCQTYAHARTHTDRSRSEKVLVSHGKLSVSRLVACLVAPSIIDRAPWFTGSRVRSSPWTLPLPIHAIQPRDFRSKAPYPRSVCTCCTPDTCLPRTRSTGSTVASRVGTASSSSAFSSRSRSPERNAARSPSRSTRTSGKFQQTTAASS